MVVVLQVPSGIPHRVAAPYREAESGLRVGIGQTRNKSRHGQEVPEGGEDGIVAWDLAAAGHLPGSRGYATDAYAARGGRDEPGSEVGIPDDLFTHPTRVVGIGRTGERAPPVALCVDRADMAAGIDEQPVTSEAREAYCSDVVLVNHYARARTPHEHQKAQANGVAGSVDEIVAQYAEVAVVIEEPDGGAQGVGTVGHAVGVNGRHGGVEEHHGPTVRGHRRR